MTADAPVHETPRRQRVDLDPHRRSPWPTLPSERALLRRLLGWAGLRALGWIVLAEAVAGAIALLAGLQSAPDASGLGELVTGGARSPQAAALESLMPLVWLGTVGLVLRAAAEAGVQAAGVRTSLRVRSQLRRAYLEPRLAGAAAAPDDVGREAVLLTHGLDGVEGQHTQVLPALAAAAVVPVSLIAWTAYRDPVSALVLVVTLPLVPAFMILIGRHTQDRIQQAAEGLDRLSGHLSELARGLPVLVGLRRAGAQRDALAAVARRHRDATLGTLRTAFVSGMALELIASLSVAVTAVLIGVRLVDGSLSLHAGLVVLVLAGEVYLPLRELGGAYHAAEDGQHARHRIETATDPAPSWSEQLRSLSEDPDVVVHVRGVHVRHGRQTASVRCPDVRLAPQEVRVLSGASGSGKSTLLHLLGGRLRAETVTAQGPLVMPPSEQVWWVCQHPQFAAETVQQELAAFGTRRPGAQVAALHAVGLLEADEADEADAFGRAEASGARARILDRLVDELSPGQRRRLALARLLGALDDAARGTTRPGATHLVLLDEPTAHLDETSARHVRGTVAGMAAGTVPGLELPPICVLAASHDPLLAASARSADTGGPAAVDPLGEHGLGQQAAAPGETRQADVVVPEFDVSPPEAPASSAQHGTGGGRPPGRVAGRRAVGAVLPPPGQLVGPIAWGAATHLSAALLAGLSGWLIVQASWQPPILHLLSVIVLVRAAGLSRAVCRYRERLATHAALLSWADALRLRLWDALGERVVDFSRLTRGGGALAALVADVDAARTAAARVLVPVPAAVTAIGCALALTGLLAPELLPAVLLPSLLGLLLVPVIVVLGGAADSARAGQHRARLLTVVVRQMRAAADTAGLHRSATALEQIDRIDRLAHRPARRAAGAVGMGRAFAVLAAGAAAGAAAWAAHLHGLDAAVTAFVVVLALSMAEPFGALATAAAQVPVLRSRARDAAVLLSATAEPARSAASIASASTPAELGPGPWPSGSERAATSAAEPVQMLRLRGVRAGYGDGPDVLRGVDLSARRGDRVVVTGPSGAGKSTLLAVVLGFLTPRAGQYQLLTETAQRRRGGEVGGEVGAMPSPRLLARVAWTPQEALVFDSTVRGNLSLARPRHDPPSEAQMRHCLALVGLDEWLEASPAGLDTRVGAEGGRLSGGQRQRLAVARCLVAGADVVLLDEPTAHLGRGEGRELMAQLREGLADTVCLVVTHDESLAGPTDQRLSLPASSQGRNSRVSPGSTR